MPSGLKPILDKRKLAAMLGGATSDERKIMASFNMPPGVSVYDIPGYDCDERMWPELRCGFCNCWVSDKDTNIIRVETHMREETCCGTHTEWEKEGVHPECDKGYWREKTGEEIERRFSDSHIMWIMPEHDAHTVETYNGTTTWYRCHHCGASVPKDEF